MRGYHEYKEIWETKIGQEAMLTREPQDKWDSNVVAVVGDEAGDTMARKQEFLNTEPRKHRCPRISRISLGAGSPNQLEDCIFRVL